MRGGITCMHFRMASLERECQDLVQNVVNQGNYASFDLVLGGLLAKHGASDLRSLGVASLPTLDILWAIQHRIGIFADTYSVNQSIISFIDFEIDLMCLLRSFLEYSHTQVGRRRTKGENTRPRTSECTRSVCSRLLPKRPAQIRRNELVRYQLDGEP